MKKNKSAEKAKKQPKAKKAEVSQWTTNPLNETVLDYHYYEMTKSEKILYFVAAFLIGGVVSQFFYGGLVEQLHIEAVLLAERGCILRQRLRRLLV